MDGDSFTWMEGTSSYPGRTILGIPGLTIATGSSNVNVGIAGFEFGGGLKMTGTGAVLSRTLVVDRRLSLSSLGPRETGRLGIASTTGVTMETSGAGCGAARIGLGETARGTGSGWMTEATAS
jgi:hypothetical protein